MVDSPNYANSPLADPNFLNSINPPAPSGGSDYSGSILNDPSFLAQAAENEPARVEERKRQEAEQARLREVREFEALSAADQLRVLEQRKSDLRSRDLNEFIGDQVTGAGGAFVGLVGGAAGLAISGVGALSQAVGEDGGALDNFGKAASDYAVDYVQTTNEVTDFIRSGQSDVKAENARINAQMGDIESSQNRAEYYDAVEAGENEFLAGLAWTGKDALDTVTRVLQDPLATEGVVVEALGSLGPSAAFARAGVNLATGVARRMGVQEGSGLAASQIIGSALGTGVIEGTGTYAQTVGAVMARSPEEMMTSPMYQNLLADGVDPIEAQKQVADAAGMEAFRINLPAAMAAGVLGAKFNANPLTTFADKPFIQGLREVGEQTLEESFQGGASQISQNLAMAEIVDDTIQIPEGVGEQIALGAIGGAGMAGAIGAVPTIKNTIDLYEAGVQADRDNARFVRGMGEQIAAQNRANARANMTPEERDADLRVGMTQTSPGAELYNSVMERAGQAADVVQNVYDAGKQVVTDVAGSGVVDTIKSGVQAAKELATPVVNTVIRAAQDYTERGNPVIQNETLDAAVKVSEAAKDPAIPTGTLGDADETITAASVPDAFKDVIPEKASLADTVVSIVKTLAENKTPISQMKDDAILFVAQKYNEMQNAASTMPADVQASIKKVLASPDLERIRKRAARIDLNTAVSSTLKTVSTAVKSMTIAMSKLNPTNVNPDVVDQILNQEDRDDLSDEDVAVMTVAAEVSRPLNAYKDNIVRIADEKNQALVSTGQSPGKNESASDKVTRDLLVGKISQRNGVPSLTETANRIIIGMQSPDKTVDVDGTRVPVAQVAGNMKNFAQHMINKVNALNGSFDLNDANGKGTPVNFDTLSKKGTMIPAGMAGSSSVNYNKGSINSVTFAKTVAADAAVAVEVHNALAKAYPDQFPDGPLTVPVLKTVENQNTDQNTTAVEEVPPAGGTDERDATPEERAVIITAIEKAYPGYKIPNLVLKVKTFEEDANGFRKGGEMYNGVMTISPAVIERIMGKQTERTLHILRHEFGHWVDFSGDYAYSDRRDWEVAVAEFDVFVDTKANEDQKRFLNYILSYRKTKTHNYSAEVFAELMGIMGVRLQFVQENMPTAFRIMNEALAEQLDALPDTTAVEDVTPVTSEPLSDGNGKPLVFYHGTKNQFTNFAGNEIFLTTQRGLAKEHALRAGSTGTPRLIAANVTVTNPLVVELEGNAELDIHWLKNALTLKSDMAAGNHDSILITNAEGDALVIATDDSQIAQITDPVKDRTPGAAKVRNLRQRFYDIFKMKKSPKPYESAEDILDMVSQKPGTRVYNDFAQILLSQIRDGMNARLDTVLFSKADGRTLTEALAAEPDRVLDIRDFKPLHLVDPATGLYDQRMLDLASMAVIDWMTTARAYGADRLDDLLDELGLDWDSLSDQEIVDMLNSVPTRSTSESLAKKVIRLWNMDANKQAQMVDIRGTTEGLVKEIFTVLSQMENPIVRVIEIKVGKGTAAAYDVSGLMAEQEAIGLAATGSLDKVLFPDEQIMASFGEKLTHVDKAQNNKPDVPLSDMEQKALKKMQDTAHNVAEPVVGFFQALGLETWSRMAGRADASNLAKRHPLRLTIEGKNTSIERDYVTAMQMVEAAKDPETGANRSVFYPVGVTNVGRHQMKGINPQNNKVLRALITPTYSKLDMVNNQKHKDAFWLTVAQSSGLAKVEKKAHKQILSTIQQDFSTKFGAATELAMAYVESGTLDQEAFANAMMVANKGEAVSVAQVNAVLAVARLNVAKTRQGELENFETTLSFELDGKTDGPANMMVALGQGLLTRMEYENFKRVGFFLGSKFETLNTFFSGGEVDLYEVNSTVSDKRMFDMINKAKGLDKDRLMALRRFAGHFGDFVIHPDGTITMSRASSKNPMTKKVYGSGETGIADGISQDMLVGFYTKLVNMPDGVDVITHLNYPEIEADLDFLFGAKFPKVLEVNNFVLPREAMVPFNELVKKTIGTILSESINEVMGTETIGVTELMVFATGVQSNFMEIFFQNRLAEIVDQRSKEFEGKFSLYKLSQADYDQVVAETMVFAPYYKDGLQNLRVGSFSGQQDKTEMSTNLSGNIRAKSTMAKPDKLGVKVIPYVIQGRGDAMMMNRIFGADNAPERAIPIFDGIDMAIADFGDLSDQINEAVLANWDHDVLSPIKDNYEMFLNEVAAQGLGDLLNRAFFLSKEKVKQGGLDPLDPAEILSNFEEAVRLNQARKAVFKEIPVAVDHMGGSGVAHVRNPDGAELTFEEINQKIQDQMDGNTGSSEPVVIVEDTPPTPPVEDETLVLTDVATVVDAIIRETKKPHIRDAIRAIRTMLPDNARIVMGTPEQVAQWRKDNLDGKPTTNLNQPARGQYDVKNNIIFIMSDNPETITHELIHMATFNAVLDHYEGTKKSTAVKNLEVLMEEFMAMDTTQGTTRLNKAAKSAKAQILKAKAKATPVGDAIALNEFMAWSLSNDALVKELKATPTGLVQKLTKTAKAWIQKILGVVPVDMYSNILFNTEMILNDDFPGGFGGGNNNNTGGQVTPPADNFTNFWIDLLRERLEQSKTATGNNTQAKLLKYVATADDALVKLDFGGFALSDYQKKTFTAIHTVIAAELRLDGNALIALGKVYEHVTNNLTPAMFGTGQAAQDRYSTVMELMGATKNDEGISDAVAVLLALSQTSTLFRSAMEQVPQPAATPGIQTTSLNDLLTSTTGFLMQKMIATTDTEGKGVKEILDALSDQILRQDDANEFKALKGLMGSFDKADSFVNGALSVLAQRTRSLNQQIQQSNTNGVFKTVAGAVTLATAFVDKDLSKQAAKGAKAATHMDGMLDGLVFIRELVAEVVGSDDINAGVIQMLDKVNYVVQSARQAYREELPVVLQNEFDTAPTSEQWKAIHHVLGKGDFAALFDLKNPDASFDLMNDQALLDRKIKDMETRLLKAFPGVVGTDILQKGQQLADYMNGKGAGFQLIKNAYAIHKLAGGNKSEQVVNIDRLISLYALKGTDLAEREAVARMQAEDPKGVHNLLVYIQALNKEEESKIVSPAARMNGYKGYIPNHGSGDVSLIIKPDAEREDLEKRGYVRVADDETDSASLVSRGYYMTTTKQGGNYSQGVLQQVQDTYRGVNATTGLTVSGTVSGVISGLAVGTVTNALNQNASVTDPKFALMPVYDEDGDVLYYERAMNPDLVEKYLQPSSNAALMIGSWAGRQVEEKFSHEYNKALVDRLKEIWDNREPNTDGLFVQMNDPDLKDKVYAESWTVIPPQLKDHIISVFGEDTGFMVRKDMINLALGYRDPSITDVWSGNHRLPEAVTLAIKVAGKATMGDKAYSWIANAESLTMGTVSTAKDLIVVRSLVVPFMNTQSNVFQLVNLGIGTKQIMKGYREKFVEIDKLNDNLKKIMGLEARVRLNAHDKNKVAILRQQIQVLKDENNRFTVAPLVGAGAYKNISEGITEIDAEVTKGRFGDWFDAQMDKLPTGAQTVVKYGLLSKDTALYRGANKAVQYGDFVAKSIYYDSLKAKGLTHDQAMVKVNEEFVNFSVLPGRMRSGLESYGATWFLTFKIRSIKIGLKMIRENPVRSMTMIGGLGLEDGPITDNLIGKYAEGTLPYSLGWDMLWDAPGINPWVSLTSG